MSSPKACVDIHRELFPTYEELLLECCRKEAALVRAEKAVEQARLAAFEKRVVVPRA